jgi:hypothetical protein
MFVPPEWWARGLPHGDGGSDVITARAQNRYRCQELHHCQDPVGKLGVTARNCITAKIL